MPDLIALRGERLRNWRQTPENLVPEPTDATTLIDTVGVASLFPASPEIPNLYHAHVGDPTRKPEAQWDSPAGKVYTWRWELGRADVAFYCVLVRSRPSWISWELLASLLRLRAELRMPDELYDLGELSDAAYRITQALEHAGGVLSTSDLRVAAGFPTGKENRAAYLKAVDELDRRLLLAKVFPQDVENMSHGLVRIRYREHVDAADAMTEDEAMDRFLRVYLPAAVYGVPVALAKDLKLSEPAVRAGFERLVEETLAIRTAIDGVKGECYLFAGA